MDAEFLRYQFENGHGGAIIKHKFKLGVRHVQILYMLVCSAAMGALRGSTGVAVLAMNDDTRRNDTYIHIHTWDKRIQGTILTSYFFGYALMLVPAELFLKKVGGKYVLTAALMVNGALTVAMPTIANKGGWIAVCNAQLWLGMTQASLSPANQGLLAKWLPPNEKRMFSWLVHAGTIIGIVVALPISGILSEARLGWELVFYSQAMLALSMAAVYGLLTASSPDRHQAVGDTEKEFIKDAIVVYRKTVVQVPWRSMLRSRQVWAAAGAHAASSALFVFYVVDVPVYLQTYGMGLKESCLYAIFPFLALWFVNVTTAPSVEWISHTLQTSFHINGTFFRKLINALGASGVVIGLTVLPTLSPEWRSLSIVVLSGTLGLMGFQYNGFMESLRDMSDNYSGTLLTIASTVAGLAGALVPLVFGAILGDDSTDMKRWRVVFLSLASFYALCNTLYTALGSSERQPWDGGAVVKHKFGYHNTVIDNQLELEELSHTKLNQQKYNDTAI